MPFGALAPLPFRLGGTGRNGLTAAQHARAAADYVAIKRVAPLARWVYTLASGVVTLHAYRGQNGVGAAHAWTAVVNGTGDVTFTFESRNFTNDYGECAPIAARGAKIGVHATAARFATFDLGRASIRIRTFDAAGAPIDAKVSVKVT